MTFDNLGAGVGDTVRAHRPVPGGGEQAGTGATAKAIGAFAAHAGGFGGDRDAAGDGEGFEEHELTIGSPAVGAGFGRAASTSLEHKAGAVGQHNFVQLLSSGDWSRGDPADRQHDPVRHNQERKNGQDDSAVAGEGRQHKQRDEAPVADPP